MNKKLRSIIIMTMILLLSISTIVFSQGEEITNVKVSINSTALSIPSQYGAPFIDNQSRTMIPLRIVSESLGHKVEWDQATKTAIIDGGIKITIGEKFVETPNGRIEMDTWAILKDTRTYVPLRFVVEALGYEVEYDGPKASNNYHHMVNIKGEVNIGDSGDGEDGAFIVKFPDGTEVSLVEGVDYGYSVRPEKSYELLEALYDTIEYKEDKANNRIEFDMYMPELPAGLDWSMVVNLKNPNAHGATIFTSDITRKPGAKQKVVIENFDDWGGEWGSMKDIEMVHVVASVKVDENRSLELIYEVKTGRRASSSGKRYGYKEYLYEDHEIKSIKDLYLPQYK